MEQSVPGQSRGVKLTVLPARLAICRLATQQSVPKWTRRARSFLSITRTSSELSIVADEEAVPLDANAERGYRVVRVQGPLPFDLVGIFAALAVPLAEAGVAIFPIATYDTDYLLVREADLSRAVAALASAGHAVTVSESAVDPR